MTVDLVDAHLEDVRSCCLPLRQFGGLRSFHGTIRTVRVLDDNALVRRTLESRGDGCVLVIDGGGSLCTALAGGQMAQLALNNGWAGLVINGAVRDVDELKELALGVNALGSNPMKSAKTGAGEMDVAVEFGGVRFQPGWHVYCDQDGILVSPAPVHEPTSSR